MDPTAEIEQLKAQVSALEDLTVVALALALKSTPAKYQQMMSMWLMSMSRVDLSTFNETQGLDLDDDDALELTDTGPVEGAEALRFEQRQRIAVRVEEAMKQMFEE